MKANIDITTEKVHKIFNYDEGALYWKIKFSRKVKIGDKAGTIDPRKGRIIISIGGIRYMASRLIFLWHKGYLPECVDGKGRQIGLFETQELAALAYNREAVKYFGEFANLNIIKP